MKIVTIFGENDDLLEMYKMFDGMADCVSLYNRPLFTTWRQCKDPKIKIDNSSVLLWKKYQL